MMLKNIIVKLFYFCLLMSVTSIVAQEKESNVFSGSLNLDSRLAMENSQQVNLNDNNFCKEFYETYISTTVVQKSILKKLKL